MKKIYFLIVVLIFLCSIVHFLFANKQYTEILKEESAFFDYKNVVQFKKLSFSEFKSTDKKFNSIIIMGLIEEYNKIERLNATIRDFTGNKDAYFMAKNKDNSILAVRNNRMQIWQKEKKKYKLIQTFENVYSCDISKNGMYLVIFYKDAWWVCGKICLYKKNELEYSKVYEIEEKDGSYYLKFDYNDLNIFACLGILYNKTGIIAIYNRNGDKLSFVKKIKIHNSHINKLIFTNNGKNLLSSTNSTQRSAWDGENIGYTIKAWFIDGTNFIEINKLFNDDKKKRKEPNYKDYEIIVTNSSETAFIAEDSSNNLAVFLIGELADIFSNLEYQKSIDIELCEKKFFLLKDEFETEKEYSERIKRGEKEKEEIVNKYNVIFLEKEKLFYDRLNIHLQKKEAFVKSEIRKSRHEIVKYIENIGEYNAEHETFPITINSITENIKIPRGIARNFKSNLDSVKVIGISQLTEDLENYEDINLNIIHPITGDKFAFGKHKSLYKTPDSSLITITTEQGNIREKPSTNSSIIYKSSKGETFSVISINNEWYNIKIDDNNNGFVHQSICNEKQVQTSDISIKPPSLKLIAELNEPSGNGFLDGEEKGKLIIQIKNSGTGPAFGVIVDIKNSSENPNLTYSQTRVPGEIAPGETKEVSFDIEANENISRATPTFTISALESNGFSPDPILLSFETHPIILPEISLIDYGVVTASGDSEIIPGETANITLRFQNIEHGKAEDIVFKMNLPNNVYFNPESKQEYSFEILPSGEYQDLEFSILTSNEVDDQIELSISMIEKHTTKKYPLTIEINKPLRSLQEFVQKGIENETTPIVIASDLIVDISNNIPKSQKTNSDAIAVVIGNRNYLKAKNVDYAINDAILMKEYLINSFGYKDGNIFYLKNASKGEFELFFGTKDNFKGKLFNTIKENTSDVFIFYSGHGAPSLKNNKGYFVPVECDPNYVELGGYSLEIFYDNLAKIPTKSLTIVIDACFSGADIFENISPIITKTSNPIISLNNGIVFSSSKDTEVSSWYNEKKHGMFTYFFLKSIHNKNADLDDDNKLTANEIIKYISDNSEGVPYYSRRIHGVEQNPQLFGKNKKMVIVNYD